jgi:CheY-like chemotaxis protein
MQPRILQLNDVLGNITRMLERIIGEHIELRCDLCPALPSIQADAGMLEQVVVNLVVNARDAMPRGGRLTIQTERVDVNQDGARRNAEARTGKFIRLRVQDTGTGIAPEHLPHIFEPFFTTKQVGKGTGLGLATVYGIAKQHQGWVEVQSSPGAGSTFDVFFPRVETREAGPDRTPEKTISGGSETILMVEDEASVRTVSRRVLESRGYHILEASSGPEALEVYAKNKERIQLLLTDMLMPGGMSGFDLGERLRQITPSLKVVFMSGYSTELTGKDTSFFRRTRSHFLQKPCTARDLLDTVRRCLDEPPDV